MKFASHEGAAARTLAYTNLPSARKNGAYAAPGSVARSSMAPEQAAPTVERYDVAHSPETNGRAAATGSGASTVNFSRGQEVFTPGQGQGLVYIVRSGCVRLYKVL